MNLRRKEIRPGIVVLEVNGRIGGDQDCQRIREEVDLLVHKDQTRVIFDLSSVHYIDSAAVGTIVRSFCSLKNSGGWLRLAGLKGMVEGVLKLTGVDRVIGIYPTAIDASQDSPSSPSP